MYELLDQHVYKLGFTNLLKFLDKEFHCRFEVKCLGFPWRSACRARLRRVELEKIAAFMKSKNFIKTPVNNKMAQWGGKKE
ncbi:Glutathione S-transferase Mu 3 [Acipenser ruthenus]|uniref:Glutathione S-transferase Mu 3 n=1 Tax=Acipenser ruthenus TaxID=7906 RepID=A0A444UWU6_ACIRT|nr:Glutathione S-transferase Mu 3 [Acipenser ruthenus]